MKCPNLSRNSIASMCISANQWNMNIYSWYIFYRISKWNCWQIWWPLNGNHSYALNWIKHLGCFILITHAKEIVNRWVIILKVESGNLYWHKHTHTHTHTYTHTHTHTHTHTYRDTKCRCKGFFLSHMLPFHAIWSG